MRYWIWSILLALGGISVSAGLAILFASYPILLAAFSATLVLICLVGLIRSIILMKRGGTDKDWPPKDRCAHCGHFLENHSKGVCQYIDSEGPCLACDLDPNWLESEGVPLRDV